MSTRTVIIWLAAALILGGAALYVAIRPSVTPPPKGSVAANERIVELDAARVRAIEVRSAAGEIQRIERRETDPGEWMLRIGTDAAAPRWALLAPRVRGILSLISTLNADAAADPAATVGERPTTVSLELDDGTIHTLVLGERTLGGMGLVEYRVPASDGQTAATRRAMVNDAFIEAFRSPGPRGWRNMAALPGVGPEIARLRVQSGTAVIALARSGGKWQLVEPVGAPANANKVAQVISALQGVVITDFQDGRTPEPALTRLESPATRIRIETDIRTPAADPAAPPQVSTRVEDLAIGGPADSTGKNLFAAIGDSGEKRVVAIDASNLATVLVTDPAAYISPQAVVTVAADVGGVSLAPVSQPAAAGGRRFKRSMGSWAEVGPDGKDSQLASADAEGVTELLGFLSARAAASVYMNPPEGYKAAGTAALSSQGGAPLEEVEIGALPTGATAVKTGGVYRAYGPEATPRLIREWLTATGAVPARAAGADGDINK